MFKRGREFSLIGVMDGGVGGPFPDWRSGSRC